MKTGATMAAGDPAAYWNELLRPVLKSPDFPKQFLEKLKNANLTFGKRVHCPFLRPFFLSPEDEERVRGATEVLARLGERMAVLALEDKTLLAQFHLRPEEERLVRLPAGRGPASTASRVDAFLLPDSLKFTEYNGESPAGAGYTEVLAEIFREMPVMKAFAKKFEVHSYALSARLLDALMGTYRDWGGTGSRPQMLITDWKEVPTWSEFQILKERFEALRVPVAVGVKVTEILQLPPAATLVPQVLFWPKSPEFAPVTAMLVMVSAPVPVLFRVTDCDALVVPTF